MFGLGKKNLTTESLGAVLAFSLVRDDDSEMLSLISCNSPLSEAAIRAEILNLRLFGLDIGAHIANVETSLVGEVRTYRDIGLEILRTGDFYEKRDPREVVIRKRVYGHIEELQAKATATDQAMSSVIERNAKALAAPGARLIRLQKYAAAFESHDLRQALFEVGGLFGTYCQVPNDPGIMLLGPQIITGEKQLVQDFVKDLRIIRSP